MTRLYGGLPPEGTCPHWQYVFHLYVHKKCQTRLPQIVSPTSDGYSLVRQSTVLNEAIVSAFCSLSPSAAHAPPSLAVN